MIRVKTVISLIVLLLFSLVSRAQQMKEYYLECNPADFAMIYLYFLEEIYVPVSITYNGVRIENAEMRIRGDGSVVLPKKSLKVKLNEGDFDGVDVFNFNADYEDKSYIQAYTTSRLMRESGVPCFQSEHVRLYLNGNYLGLYISVENMDEDFLTRNGFNPNGNLYKATLDGASMSRYDNVFYHWEQKTGTGNREDLQELIFQLDTISVENYKLFLQEKFDYNAIINILAMNLLCRNHSTYYHNYYMFHDTNGSGKWHMFPWDLDKGFLYYESTISYYHTSKFWAPDNPIMELACLSPAVMADIEQRIDVLFETRVNDATISQWVDSLNLTLASSVADDTSDNLLNDNDWQTLLNVAKTAFNANYNQLKYQFQYILKPFSINKIKHRFFPGEPIQFNWDVCVSPLEEVVQYRFYLGNSADLESSYLLKAENLRDTSYLISTTLQKGKYFYKIEAYTNNFEAEAYNNYNIFYVDSDSSGIVFNEINYNPDAQSDCGEWIEIYNTGNDTTDISGWRFSDNNDTHNYIFPSGSKIAPEGYVVIAGDSSKFNIYYPDCNCLSGYFNFSLDNSGELLRLYNTTGRIVDSLIYLPSEPWPVSANGGGFSLELNDAFSDNTQGENWSSVHSFGSPCKAITDTVNPPPDNSFAKLRVFPNPVADQSNIVYYTTEGTEVCITVCDLKGNNLYKNCSTHTYSGYFAIGWNADDHENGVYLISLYENMVLKKTIRLVQLR